MIKNHRNMGWGIRTFVGFDLFKQHIAKPSHRTDGHAVGFTR